MSNYFNPYAGPDVGNDANSLSGKLFNHLEQSSRALRATLENTVVQGNTRELERIENYYVFWKFYDGKHYREFNHAFISLNYVRVFIDKLIQFTLGDDGFSFKVTSMYNDVIPEELETNAEEVIMYHWRRNNKNVTSHEILQMGSICGDVWVMPTWLPKEKYVRIQTLDSRQCFPIFKNGDINELESFQVRIPLESHKDGYKLHVINYTLTEREEWYQKTATIHKPVTAKQNDSFGSRISEVFSFNLSNKDSADTYNYSRTDNPYGFIPIVHIKNRPNSSDYYGKSDAADTMKINKVFNEMHQEIKGIIDYHATPVTIVTGAKLTNATRGLGNIWSGLPPEANVFNLGLDADLSTMMSFMQMLKAGMHELSDIPESVLGKIQSISGTSAAALQLTYQPLVQQANLKALTYGEGITEINSMVLRIALIMDPDNARLKKITSTFNKDTIGTEVVISPIFKYGFPTDRMAMLQEFQIETQFSLSSRKTILNKLGVNNVPSFIESIDADRVADAEKTAQINSILMPPMPDGSAPPDASAPKETPTPVAAKNPQQVAKGTPKATDKNATQDAVEALKP